MSRILSLSLTKFFFKLLLYKQYSSSRTLRGCCIHRANSEGSMTKVPSGCPTAWTLQVAIKIYKNWVNVPCPKHLKQIKIIGTINRKGGTLQAHEPELFEQPVKNSGLRYTYFSDQHTAEFIVFLAFFTHGFTRFTCFSCVSTWRMWKPDEA